MNLSEYRKLNDPLSRCAVLIGIDAGVYTGVAVGTREGVEPIYWKLLDFWSAYDFISKFNPDHTGIVIEVPTGHVIHHRVNENASGFGRDRQAANVGSNRREAALLAERFESMGFAVARVKPTRTKWKADDLARHTGITAKTNEHTRDAIRLIWERI